MGKTNRNSLEVLDLFKKMGNRPKNNEARFPNLKFHAFFFSSLFVSIASLIVSSESCWCDLHPSHEMLVCNSHYKKTGLSQRFEKR